MVEGPVPLKRPLFTGPQLRAAVKKWTARFGFGHPWKVYVVLANCKKNQWCDENDKLVYACAGPSFEYSRVTLRFDPYHPGFEGENLDEVVRHELLHALLHSYTHQAQHNAANDAVKAMLESAEEELVTRLSTLPLFTELDEHREGYVQQEAPRRCCVRQ